MNIPAPGRISGRQDHRPAVTAPTLAPARARDRWVDRLAGFDPGQNRFRTALQSVLAIALILVAEWLFVHFTHALQIQAGGARMPAAQAAEAAANHSYLLIAMMVGGFVGLLSTVSIIDKTARGQLITMLYPPVPMIAALFLGTALGGHRALGLASMAVIMALGTYLRRFGPRWAFTGGMLFVGYLVGFFLHGSITPGQSGWIAAEIGVGFLVDVIARFALFRPNRAKALERTQRSFTARARKVAALSLALFDDPGQSARDGRRLHRHLVRLNEAALMIDAQIGDPGTLADGPSARLLHQYLFDAELALANIADFAQALGGFGLPAPQRFEARLALRNLVRGENEAAGTHARRLTGLLHEAGPGRNDADRAAVVVAHRFAGSVSTLADALTGWMAVGAGAAAGDGECGGTFRSSAKVFGGWLPGSAIVTTVASLESGARPCSRPGDRIRLALHSRTAIQMGIASGAAIALGDLLSPRHYYWAAIAVFVTLTAVGNSGEQVRKAGFRVAGTLVGIAAGSLLVTAVGAHTGWAVVVSLSALFAGFYLQRVNYAFTAAGASVMASQLYAQFDEFSDSLLLLRLEETALGAGVAMVVVTLVLPLRTRRVLRIALRHYVQAVRALAEHAGDHLVGNDHDAEATLRSDARAVDAAYQAVTATAESLRRKRSGYPGDAGRALRLASAARNHSRNLVADAETAGPLDLDADTRLDIELATATLCRCLGVVADALTGPRDGIYTRSSGLFDQAELRIEERSGPAAPARLAVRDLMLLDATMAAMAELLGLRACADRDTTPTTSPTASGRADAGRG